MRRFWAFASEKSKIGMTGLTSWAPRPVLERFLQVEKNRSSLSGFFGFGDLALTERQEKCLRSSLYPNDLL
jgi:hypothetical protein